jgi:hypothetical protein
VFHLITSKPTGKFLLNLVAGEALAGDLDAITFNPVLNHFKMNEFKFLRWMLYLHHCACSAMGWDCLAFVNFHGYVMYHL